MLSYSGSCTRPFLCLLGEGVLSFSNISPDVSGSRADVTSICSGGMGAGGQGSAMVEQCMKGLKDGTYIQTVYLHSACGNDVMCLPLLHLYV